MKWKVTEELANKRLEEGATKGNVAMQTIV